MGSVYEDRLPFAFPWVLLDRRSVVQLLVRSTLDAGRTDCPFGSSFAITVEHMEDWYLWMSDATYNYLKRLFPDVMLGAQRAVRDVAYAEPFLPQHRDWAEKRGGKTE